jgi:cytochrome b subunit of formate dehydrogenase
MLNGRKSDRRYFHWIIAFVFLAMVLTGLTLLVPALSGLAAGGWSRLVHKVFAVLLVSAPLIYFFMNRSAVGIWFREAAVWRRKTSTERYVIHSWRRRHKLIMSAGFIIVVVTGSIQWFLKGIVPSSVFNASLLVHDIAFFSALLILLYHVYFELVWRMWRRKYCSRCQTSLCADECPVNAVSSGNDGKAERNMKLCNGCRLCMKSCQREGYYIRTVRSKNQIAKQAD